MSRIFPVQHIQGHLPGSQTRVRAGAIRRMNFLVVVLCWIVSSTLLGILFGYSHLGLTTSTSIVALLLGLVLPGVPAIMKLRKSRFEPAPRRGLFAYVVCIFFLAFAVREFSQVIYVTNDSVRVISPNNIGDTRLHLPHINYLASDPHFWPENPIFAFDKLRYPIGLNLFNAELKLVGVDPRLGIILVAFLGSILTLRALFLFNGSLGVAALFFYCGLSWFFFFLFFS